MAAEAAVRGEARVRVAERPRASVWHFFRPQTLALGHHGARGGRDILQTGTAAKSGEATGLCQQWLRHRSTPKRSSKHSKQL